ncbi:MAG: hypothetical protein R3B13_16610 [Polyangiaceae bacterium]
MKLRELADEIVRRIDAGEIDPDAIVVRPLCMCDEEVGYVEAQFLDQVVRQIDSAPDVAPPGRIYRHGNAPASRNTAVTVKLG